MKFAIVIILTIIIATITVIAQPTGRSITPIRMAEDVHSYANPEQVRVTHVALDWDVLFDQKIIKGSVTLTLNRAPDADNPPLILDSKGLNIQRAEVSADGKTFVPTTFTLGAVDKILGAPLAVKLTNYAKYARVYYSTNPDANGLQWLAPEQTAGMKLPYMFSQAEAINARTFIPLQDSPQIRVTYSATVRTPKTLRAVMSSETNSQNSPRTGVYQFNMTKPIPSYLIAIAVGDIDFAPLGKRTGVYTEPSMLKKSAFELADTEKMVIATEKLYGPYRWGRYDILVLPPSFPIGGMENPCLTFATPTILAGDRSLVSLIAHELAHNWSGNLVTNATWRDSWLNEGMTTYLERRIIEMIYGKNRREMEAMLAKQGLIDELAELPPPDQVLHVNLAGRDPDDGFTGVPYEKGALFLRHLEESFGRTKFDDFLKGYFNTFSFKSITTEIFKEYLRTHLIEEYPNIVSMADVDTWIEEPGLPKNAPAPKSDSFSKVDDLKQAWVNGKITLSQIPVANWTTQEWLHFLKNLPSNIGTKRMTELDKAFGMSKKGNSEIVFQWLLMSIQNDYKPAFARLQEFLTTVGRRKFVKPLYAELMKTPGGAERAKAIYAIAKPRYHPITQAAVEAIVK